jgi:hypothetical protein
MAGTPDQWNARQWFLDQDITSGDPYDAALVDGLPVLRPLETAGDLRTPRGKACVTWNGVDMYQNVPGLAGTEVITNEGTATPTPSAGRIDWTAGTCWNIKVDGVTVWYCNEESGRNLYANDTSDPTGDSDIVNGSESSFRATDDGVTSNPANEVGFTPLLNLDQFGTGGAWGNNGWLSKTETLDGEAVAFGFTYESANAMFGLIDRTTTPFTFTDWDVSLQWRSATQVRVRQFSGTTDVNTPTTIVVGDVFLFVRTGTNVEIFQNGVSFHTATGVTTNVLRAGANHTLGIGGTTIVKAGSAGTLAQTLYFDVTEGSAIPRDEAIPAQDVLGGTLQYTGLAPLPATVETPLMTFAGTEYISAPHLVGTETINSYTGTATPSISAGRIDATGGTLGHVVIDDGTNYPLTEGDGRTVYDVSTGGNHGTIVNGTLQDIWANRTDAVRDHCIEYGGRMEATVFVPGLLDGTNAANGSPITLLAKQHGNPFSRIDFDNWATPELAPLNLPALSPPGELLRTTAPIDTKFRSEENATTPFADGDNRFFNTPDTLTGQDLTDAVAYIGRTAAPPSDEGIGTSAGSATVTGVGSFTNIQTGVGSSAGAATVTGVSSSTNIQTGVGSSSGVATVQGYTGQLSAPINDTPPVVTGTPEVGQTLSTTDGTWTANPAPTYTYQWKRGVPTVPYGIFDGVDDQVSTNINRPGAPCTICIRYRPPPANQVNSSVVGGSGWAQILQTTHPNCSAYTQSPRSEWIIQPITVGDWNFIAMRWNGANEDCLLEGISLGLQANATTARTESMEIGSQTNNTNYAAFDCSEYWQFASYLTDQELADLMADGTSVTRGIQLHYDFSDGSGTQVTDQSGNGNHGTLKGDDGTNFWGDEPTARASEDIPGATESTYTVTGDDVGQLIHCVVTATNSEGASSAGSNEVGPVTQTISAVGSSDGSATAAAVSLAYAVGQSSGQATVLGVQDTAPADIISIKDAVLVPGRATATHTAGKASATLTTF